MLETRPPAVAGRYVLVTEVATGGMASVHLGRVRGPAGFSKVVAIKRLHPHLAREPEVVARFLDEARLAARIRHANVVPTLDVVEEGGEVFLVMEYVLGATVAQLLRAANGPVPPDVAAAIAAALLQGLHAAHEARAEDGSALGIVHRDVSPQNVIVGADGSVRVVDFGIAKATGQTQATREGELKGKAPYMPPEQIRGRSLDRRADVYSAGVVLWEMLTGRRLFTADDPLTVMLRVCEETAPPPSRFARVPAALDGVVARALDKSAERRFATAHEFADALEHALPLSTPRGIARWVESVAGAEIADRARAMESAASGPSPSFPDESRAPSPEPAGAPPDVTAAAATSPAPRAANDGASTTETVLVRPAGSRQTRRVAVATAGIVLVVVALALMASRRGATSPAEIPPATAATSATPDETNLVFFEREAPLVPEEPPVEISLDPEPTTRATQKRPKPKASPNTCNPPWVLDQEGIKILKPECR